MPYRVVKTFGNDRGYSCAFRQRNAKSHCRHLHGYALGFEFTIEADVLDERNWVFDFGGFDAIKEFLSNTFDHTVAIAKDDTMLSNLLVPGSAKDLVNLRFMDEVGCEAFAKYVFDFSKYIVKSKSARLVSVRVFEHCGNSAIYEEK